MKTFLMGLSLLGLIMVSSTLRAEEAKAPVADKAVSATDAEVLALVDAAAKAEKKSEADTPVFKNPLDSKKDKTQSSAWVWIRMIGSLSLVLILFVGGVYGFRSMSTRGIATKAKMIQVLSQHHMGAKKSLAVVRVAGETVLVGITDNNISLLKTLSLLDEDTQTNVKFNKTLSQKITPDEDFSMKGLKEIIGERLKTMKELG